MMTWCIVHTLRRYFSVLRPCRVWHTLAGDSSCRTKSWGIESLLHALPLSHCTLVPVLCAGLCSAARQKQEDGFTSASLLATHLALKTGLDQHAASASARSFNYTKTGRLNDRKFLSYALFNMSNKKNNTATECQLVAEQPDAYSGDKKSMWNCLWKWRHHRNVPRGRLLWVCARSPPGPPHLVPSECIKWEQVKHWERKVLTTSERETWPFFCQSHHTIMPWGKQRLKQAGTTVEGVCVWGVSLIQTACVITP